MCQWAEGLTVNVRFGLAVLFYLNSRQMYQFIREGGDLENARIEWEGSKSECKISFDISGVFGGTSIRKKFSLIAKQFVLSDKKQILIHDFESVRARVN
jgi:hypothetical protein